MTTSNPAEFAAGAIFGSALYFAGVYDPHTILSQMGLQSWDMLQVMLGASATSALIIHLAARANYSPKRPRAPAALANLFPYDGNLVGGALVGLGMALSGACPGTVLVQFGLGLPRAGTAMAGCLLGAAIYDVAVRPAAAAAAAAKGEKDVKDKEQQQQKKKKKKEEEEKEKKPVPTIHASLGIGEETLLAAWVALCVVGLVALRPLRTGRGATDPVLGGLGVGAAQTATILLARHSIGVSAAYGDLTGSVAGLFGGGRKAGITPSIAFGAGVLGVAALLPKVPSGVDVGAARALVGGVTMVLGARIGGGCTSGHGISGMATFATASVVTTAAMFGAGIAGSAGLRALGW